MYNNFGWTPDLFCFLWNARKRERRKETRFCKAVIVRATLQKITFNTNQISIFDFFFFFYQYRGNILEKKKVQEIFLTYRSKTLKTLNTEFRAAKKSKKIVILWEFKAFVKKLWFESIGHIRGNKAIRFAAIKRKIFVKWWLFFQMFYFCLSIIILFSILKLFTDLFQNSLMQNICKSKLNNGWYENRTSPGKICDSKANIQL